MSRISILAWFGFCSIAVGGCPPWSDSPNLPLCPENGLLSDEFPALAWTLSEDSKVEPSATERNLVRSQLAKTAKNLFEAAGDRPPLLFLTTSRETFAAISSAVGKKAAENLRWIAPTDVEGMTWQQDILQDFADPRSGKTVLRAVEDYPGFDSHSVKKLTDSMSEACDKIQLGSPLRSHSREGKNAESGGNIEAIPFGLCLVGDNQPEAYTRQFCAKKDEIRFPTSFLKVGHVDEVVAVHKVKGETCKVVVSVASVDKAIELLRKKPTQKIFDFALAGTNDSLSEVEKVRRKHFFDNRGQFNMKPGLFGEFCRHFALSPTSSRASDSTLPIPEDLHVAPRKARGPVKIACSDALVSDFLSYYDRHLKEKNEAIQKSISAGLEKLVGGIKSRAPKGCAVETLPLPQLYSRGESLFPNPSNGIRVDNTFIFPDPQNGPFRDYLQEAYRSKGMKSEFVDSTHLHADEGNLHCSTNAIRTCRANKDAKVVAPVLALVGKNAVPTSLSWKDQDHIARLMKSPDEAVRAEVLTRIADSFRHGDEKEMPKGLADFLKKHVSDESELVLAAFANLANRFARKGDSSDLLTKSPRAAVRKAMLDYIRENRIHRKALAPFVQASLEDADASVVKAALGAVDCVDLPRKNWEHFATHKDSSVRLALIAGLVKCHGDGGDLIRAALSDPSVEVRRAAAGGMRMITGGNLSPLVARGLDDKDAQVRQAVLDFVFRLSSPEKYLAEVLKRPAVFAEAFRVMARAEPEIIDRVLEAAIRSKDKATREVGYRVIHDQRRTEYFNSLPQKDRLIVLSEWKSDMEIGIVFEALSSRTPALVQAAADIVRDNPEVQGYLSPELDARFRAWRRAR